MNEQDISGRRKSERELKHPEKCSGAGQMPLEQERGLFGCKVEKEAVMTVRAGMGAWSWMENYLNAELRNFDMWDKKSIMIWSVSWISREARLREILGGCP